MVETWVEMNPAYGTLKTIQKNNVSKLKIDSRKINLIGMVEK